MPRKTITFDEFMALPPHEQADAMRRLDTAGMHKLADIVAETGAIRRFMEGESLPPVPDMREVKRDGKVVTVISTKKGGA
jgi:hypothetical protein